ncbi:MAG: YifB family Mg chelatase-like AAA ATPase [Streptosporangiales bacterium]|nr:YifB family Mg chelatase-like AAA ATPase [Streptosporangiales bacterium]
MSLARTRSVALVGVEGHMVEVEAHIAAGLAGLHLVGLPDTALREARDRIRAAVINSAEDWPDTRITVSLGPASLPKRGSGFDLAIAVAVLAAAGSVPVSSLDDAVLLGELGLDGRLHPVPGVLPAVLAAVAAGCRRAVVPESCLPEARLVEGVRVIPAASLAGVLAYLSGRSVPDDPPAEPLPGPPARGVGDLSDVLGQPLARRALEICAAGGHNLWMLGPPGTGKSMLAERLTTILPPLSRAEAIETTAIHSVAGLLPRGHPLIDRPPFRDPHHTSSKPAIVGGGSGRVRPGAASLAHNGVLFLDEAPEFDRGALDALRQPLETGEIHLARAWMSVRLPARFMLVLAANPCPCSRTGTRGCLCPPDRRRRYLSKLSGPLLDRIDVKVSLHPVGRAELLADRAFAESSATVAQRVAEARRRATRRLTGTPWRSNAQLPGPVLRRDYRPADAAIHRLETALDRGQLSARGVDRVLRLSWTLADLAGRDRPTPEDTAFGLALWQGAHP